MTDDEMIAVIAAHRDGETLEMKTNEPGSKWVECPCPLWNFCYVDYRVKPKQRRGFVAASVVFESREMAEACMLSNEILEIVEVVR